MKARLILPLLAVLLLCSCTVNTQKDYEQYLENNQSDVTFRSTNKEFCYNITERTMAHKQNVKTWMGGIMNTWEVEFGPMLQSTMRAAYVQMAFTSLKQGFDASCKWKMELDLVNYEFIDNRAKVSLAITTTSPGGRASSKQYYAEGQAQAGKMFFGGGFAMKNAIQQSTKSAIDQIFTQYFNEFDGQQK